MFKKIIKELVIMIKIVPMIYKIFNDLISYNLYKDIFKYINANKNPNTPSNG